MLALRFLEELRGIARRVKGIESIWLGIREPVPVEIPVRGATQS
jgi:hypothetical protein